jgi:uncharacterized protein YbjT (DUF2867 family)
MGLSVIITGASGMVGEGVLHECLNHAAIDRVLVIGRRPCGTTHPKMKEVLHGDFFNLTPIANQLQGYQACYFCLGISSVGLDEATYHHLTYDLTVHAAEIMLSKNPGMTFVYVSGAGTDSTEKGKIMWARVKGKTENKILNLGFGKAFAFRPGVMKPTPGMKNTLKLYFWLGWLYPIIKLISPGSASTLAVVGQVMINVSLNGYSKSVLEVRDINAAGEQK